MQKKRIWGTNLYVSFEGFIFTEDGKQLKTGLIKGRHYFRYKNRTYLVHRVVAEAFIKQSKKAIRHLDGDIKNNAAWNLEYV